MIEDDPRITFLLSLGDDDFFVGHRLSSWLATSPTLEEDNVLTSIAQDELGHARLWYDIVASESDESIDDLAIWRSADRRRNSITAELSHNDFADVIARNYLYDAAEGLLLESIAAGEDDRLADSATVALEEEEYHLEHADRWLDILTSTAESRERLADGFRRNLLSMRDFFHFGNDVETQLVESGTVTRSFDALESEWIETVAPTIAGLQLDLSRSDVDDLLSETGGENGRAGEHTDELADLIESMQPAELDRI